MLQLNMSQFVASQQQQIMLAEQRQQQTMKMMKSTQRSSTDKKPIVAKVTKVRRTRQSRNPQLSVARRNERERNRVKMVNNGFALLRDRLPVEFLAIVNGGSGSQQAPSDSGCDTPDVSSLGGGTKSPCPSTDNNNNNNNNSHNGASGKSKKCSKVETLRATIKYIRSLTEVLAEAGVPIFSPGSLEAGEQQVEDTSSSSHAMTCDEADSASAAFTSSYNNPLSCGSASSQSNHPQQQQQQQQQAQPHMSFRVQYHGQQAARSHEAGEQFVKLEPTLDQFQHQQLSPFETAQTTIATTASTVAAAACTTPLSTQSSSSYHNNQQQQQQQQQPMSQVSQVSADEASEHTHLWIQQHQSSFIEQQQQQYDWSPYQQQQQYAHEHLNSQHQQQQQPSPVDNCAQPYASQQQQQQHQQQQLDSPPAHWFTPSPASQSAMQQQQEAAGSLASHAQYHISLYG